MLTVKNRVTRLTPIHNQDPIETDITIDILTKLTSSIGYLQQTEATLNKNIYTEKDIAIINRRLDRIPPEVLQQADNPIDPTLIIPTEQ